MADVSNYCSAAGEFSNIGATQSLAEDAYPTCIPRDGEPVRDVWFSFIAQANAVAISVTGQVANNTQGTLRTPQFVLYEGGCSNPMSDDNRCSSDNRGRDETNAIITGLMVGQRYYISVSGRDGDAGTFQLCVRNFNQPPTPSGDCDSGVVLCDKSSFSVPFLSGSGSLRNEIGDVSCNVGGCRVQEQNSAWYKWTCDQPGSLTFRITPLNPDDDLDFVLYELPNGIDDCGSKQDLRCMASGENVGAPFSEWFPCTGATGLSEADPDQSESCGCQTGDNNFASAIEMEEGRSYALVILNFSSSGSGFSIEFGGSGTFEGPQADFTTSVQEVCVGETMSFSDASSFVGTITDYRWNFGPNAEPMTATGQGPHQVRFTQAGTQSVTLEVETDRGCLVTELKQVDAICCPDYYTASAVTSPLQCPNDSSGQIDLTASSLFGPIRYEWSVGTTTEDIFGLGIGDYQVILEDASTCRDSFVFTIEGPEPFDFDTSFVLPTCDGGMDGAITLEVTGGTAPYQYNWDNSGFQPQNQRTNLGQGSHDVVVQDANGCETSLDFQLNELQLILDPFAQIVDPPSCFGFSDGSIQIAIGNGQPPYRYNFNDTEFQTSPTLSGIPAGTYRVETVDANLCEGFFEIEVGEPEALDLLFLTEDIRCSSETNGSIEAIVAGGTGPYQYQWNSGQNTAAIDNLPAGDYFLTVTDANNCLLESDTSIIEPESIGAAIGNVTDNLCFGDANGSIEAIAQGGTPPYTYSIDGINFQSESIIGQLPAGTYEILIRDVGGCTVSATATVEEPDELLVDAGMDASIILGFDTTLNAVSNYPGSTFAWSPDSLECLTPDCSRILVRPLENTEYQVVVVNENGCVATDVVLLTVAKDRPVFIPNAFSPNFDDRNDGFTLFGGPSVDRIERFQVFDRWGNLMWETEGIAANTPDLGWDGNFNGEPVNPGVYVYVFEVLFIDGEIVQYSGDVAVLR